MTKDPIELAIKNCEPFDFRECFADSQKGLMAHVYFSELLQQLRAGKKFMSENNEAFEGLSDSDRVKKLEDALRFYADEVSYDTHPICCCRPKENGDCCGIPEPAIEVMVDNGQRARDALEG